MSSAFSLAWATPSSEASTPRTEAAPAMPAFRAKEPVWVKPVQHFGSPAEALNRQPVVFLVQEEAGFLAVLDVHQVFHSVLLNLNLGVERLADEAFEALHPLLEADFGVAALVDAPDGDAVLRQNLF